MDKYTWVDFGDSYLPSELNAAYLYPQLLKADEINDNRLAIWNFYDKALRPLEEKGYLKLATIPDGCVHNAHMYYVKLKDLKQRTEFISFLKEHGVQSTFHYVPLHSAPAGLRFGRFYGEDEYTTKESERLTRLPMYYNLSVDDAKYVVQMIYAYFKEDASWISQL